MDARRDMYYIGTKDKIELIYKDKIPELRGKILSDKRSIDIVKNAICYEEQEKDIAKTMIKLALEKYNSSNDKNEFNYMRACANYIQTPPIFTN